MYAQAYSNVVVSLGQVIEGVSVVRHIWTKDSTSCFYFLTVLAIIQETENLIAFCLKQCNQSSLFFLNKCFTLLLI